MLDYTITRTDNPTSAEELNDILANPGFGKHFTDHMVTIDWTEEKGWHDAQVRPYGPMTMEPATNVFHYGQAIFEGIKAYLSLIHISEPTRLSLVSRMPSSA